MESRRRSVRFSVDAFDFTAARRRTSCRTPSTAVGFAPQDFVQGFAPQDFGHAADFVPARRRTSRRIWLAVWAPMPSNARQPGAGIRASGRRRPTRGGQAVSARALRRQRCPRRKDERGCAPREAPFKWMAYPRQLFSSIKRNFERS